MLPKVELLHDCETRSHSIDIASTMLYHRFSYDMFQRKLVITMYVLIETWISKGYESCIIDLNVSDTIDIWDIVYNYVL